MALVFLWPLSVAQRSDFLARSEVLLMGGGMNYVGDLNNQSVLTLPGPAGALGLRYRIDNRWSLRAQGGFGRVACEEDYIPIRNLSFRSDIWEFAALAEFNFAPFGTGPTERLWTAYLFGGLAVFHFNPLARYSLGNGEEAWAELQPLCTEGQGSADYPDRKQYALTQLSLPFGMGFKVRLGKSFSLSAEYGLRLTWTDYLDDVSTTYVGSEFLQANSPDGPLAASLADRSGEVEPGYVNATGIKRGDDYLNDWYTFLNISLGISLDTLLGWTRSKRCRN